MTEAEITELVSTQRNYFKTGETLSVAYRIAALKKLKNIILSHENEILAASTLFTGKAFAKKPSFRIILSIHSSFDVSVYPIDFKILSA